MLDEEEVETQSATRGNLRSTVPSGDEDEIEGHNRPPPARSSIRASITRLSNNIARSPMRDSIARGNPARRMPLRHSSLHTTYGDQDCEDLAKCIADAGRQAFGTVMVEVWTWDEDTCRLVQPNRGSWISPFFFNPSKYDEDKDEDNFTLESNAMSQLTDESLPSYVPPDPVIAGEGLPGFLWSEISGGGVRGFHWLDASNGLDSSRHQGLDNSMHQSIRGSMRQSIMRPGTPQSRRQSMRTSRPDRLRQSMRQSLNIGALLNLSHHSKPVLGDLAEGNDKTEIVPSIGGSRHGNRNRRRSFFRGVSGSLSTHRDQELGVAEEVPKEQDQDADEPELYDIPIMDHTHHHRVVWRDVKALANDPDQPWNPRLQLLAEAGLGWAAAVPLRPPGGGRAQGIVIYMARGSVDQLRLQADHNEAFLEAMASVIAANLFLRMPRKIDNEVRKAKVAESLRRVRKRIRVLRAMGYSLNDIFEGKSESTMLKDGKTSSTSDSESEDKLVSESSPLVAAMKAGLARAHKKIRSYLLKAKGGGVNVGTSCILAPSSTSCCKCSITISS